MRSEFNSLREFGEFRLDPEKKVLWYKNEPLALPLKEIELLCVLTESTELVTKEELLDRVWSDSFVEESNLSSHIYRLRKMFAKYGESEDIIKTVPKRGYRFTGQIIQTDKSSALIIEKHSISRTMIEEIDNSIEPNIKALAGKPPSNRYWIPLLICLIILITTFGYYIYSRNSNKIEGIKSIAVLPLKSFDERAVDESLRLRMMDSLITKLGKIESISIRPTSSTMKFLKSDENSLEIGKKLVVDAILEGSIQREDNKIRVTLQLVSVKNGEQIWSEQFDGESDKLLDLQNSVSAQLFNKLNLPLSNEQQTALASRPTSNSDAYEEYLKGRFFWNKRTPESQKSAISSFEKAVRLDPNFAEAYVGLADSYYLIFDYSIDTSPKILELAKTNLTKAIELNPNLSEAYTLLGLIQTTNEWNWKAAEESFPEGN